MRRPALVTVFVLALALGLFGPAGAALDLEVQPLPGVSVTTDNVEHVGHLGEAGPSVSARVLEVDGERRFYLSSIKGFSIYNIDDPAVPQLIGALPLPNFQNEDMAVSDDGAVALLAIGDANQHNVVVDTSNPQLPTVASTILGGDHTLECADPQCAYAYGSEGRTYQVRDPETLELVDIAPLATGWQAQVQAQLGRSLSQSAHKLVRDAAGLIITDTVPRVMLDPADPENPQVLTVGLADGTMAEVGGGVEQLAYQHNNIRPRAVDWTPRGDEELEADGLRDGELLLINGETNLRRSCDGSSNGPFATMSVTNFDREQEMEVLDVFRPVDNGNYLDGNPAVNGLGCSGHWFDWIDNPASVGDDAVEDDSLIVAAAWFEHGVRFLKVEADSGAISEVGFFQPFNGSTGATYWVEHEGEHFAFVTDYVRGVDILKFNPDVDLRPSEDELTRNWLAGLNLPQQPETVAEQLLCRLATER